MGNRLLNAVDIEKRFGHIQALQKITLDFCAGQVHAIVGDNGAGKSTFIKILSGALKPDSGVLCLGEEQFYGFSAGEAIRHGISTVYQDLALAGTRNVSDNIFLGRELSRFGFLDKREMKRQARKLIDALEIQIPDVSVPVDHLSGGQRQGVAVARLIHQGGKLLIFDEPTAAMGITEASAVTGLMRKLADDGYGVVLVSHNLPQVFEISDRISVFCRGQLAATLQTDQVSMEQVVALITGGREGDSV